MSTAFTSAGFFIWDGNQLAFNTSTRSLLCGPKKPVSIDYQIYIKTWSVLLDRIAIMVYSLAEIWLAGDSQTGRASLCPWSKARCLNRFH
jgi:hypothetical protein